MPIKAQIIVPVYRPDERFLLLLNGLRQQNINPLPLLVLNSGGADKYKIELSALNAEIYNVASAEFNHGGTRQRGIDICPDKDIYIFFTQDAVPADENTLGNLIAALADEHIGAAYGRQLPQSDANASEIFARRFNYGTVSVKRSLSDAPQYGLKTAFLSNSFAAYRADALEEVGGFPSHTILCEDMYVAAKMLLAGWQIAYVAEAEVYHSHNNTLAQLFRRYFDIGVFHAREAWLRQTFGAAEGSGLAFVGEELKYLFHHAPLDIPMMFLRDFVKFIAYKLGLNEKYLPQAWKQKMSLSKTFWRDKI